MHNLYNILTKTNMKTNIKIMSRTRTNLKTKSSNGKMAKQIQNISISSYSLLLLIWSLTIPLSGMMNYIFFIFLHFFVKEACFLHKIENSCYNIYPHCAEFCFAIFSGPCTHKSIQLLKVYFWVLF